MTDPISTHSTFDQLSESWLTHVEQFSFHFICSLQTICNLELTKESASNKFVVFFLTHSQAGRAAGKLIDLESSFGNLRVAFSERIEGKHHTFLPQLHLAASSRRLFFATAMPLT